MAEAVFIRPIVESDLDLLELLYEDPDEAGEFGFYGYHNDYKLSATTFVTYSARSSGFT